MNKEEFVNMYSDFMNTALAYAEKARREGLLSLEDSLDRKKADERDVFHYGIRFVVDGIACELIEKILSNIIAQEKDEYLRKFKIIQQEAVLSIQAGYNPEILRYLLNSYTDLSIKDDSVFTNNEPEPDTDSKYDAYINE